MIPTALLFGVAATGATLAGGLLALRLRRRIVLVLGLSAGIVLGVALFDLLPEAIALGRGQWSVAALAGWMAGGLGCYLALDRLLERARAAPRWRAQLGPATLTLHSLLDGLGIGLAFHVDQHAGWLVALGVLTHDLADGINTVSLALAAGSEAAARRWLVLNALAPVSGVVLGLAIMVPADLLAPLLAAFAGIFFYIGAGELVPRSLALDPRPRTVAAGLAGMALMFAVAGLAR